MTYCVYNVKTGKTWSWSFTSEDAAEKAIFEGHSHNVDHLIVSSYGGERKEIPHLLSEKISEFFFGAPTSLEILLELKWDGKYTTKPESIAYNLHDLGLIEIVGPSCRLTEFGNLIITRLILKSGMTKEMRR